MSRKTIIITLLLGLSVLMVIGYAAFNTTLNINGTAAITSTWDVEITNVTVKEVNGSAIPSGTPVYNKTAANFRAELISPSDSVVYEVTVSNLGSLDAKVESIEMTDSNNPAIRFETQGILENDLLKAKEEQKFLVTIAYDDEVTTQPENLTGSLSVKLNYVQNR